MSENKINRDPKVEIPEQNNLELSNLPPNRPKFSSRSFLMRKLLNRTRQQPKILSEEEIAQLKQPAKQKQVIAICLAITGIIIIISALSLFLSGIVIEWLTITYEYQDEEVVVNISPIFSIILTYIGVWQVSRYSVNRNLLRENTTYVPYLSLRREPLDDKDKSSNLIKIRSFASSRLFSAIILLIMVFSMALKFGITLTGENHIGNWFVLGGPSLFYPTAFIPAFISVALVIYVFLSSAVITFSKTDHFYCIEEYRFMAPWKTEIPIQDVIAIRITNANTGPKFLWAFIFIPQIYGLYTDGFHLLLNRLNFGNAIMNGTVYLISGTVQLIVMLILLFKTQTLLEIATKDKYYELQFAPPSMMPIIKNAIEELFGIPALTKHSRKHQLANIDPGTEDNDESRFKNAFIQDWYQMIFGISLIMIALFSQIYSFFLGEFPRVIFYIFGFIFLIRGFKSDFSSPRSKMVIFHHKTKNELYVRREWAWINEGFRFIEISKDKYSIEPSIRKLDFWDILACILIPSSLGFSSGLTIPYSIPGTASASFPMLHFGLSIVIMIAFLYFMILPRISLKINGDSITYQMSLAGARLNLSEREKKLSIRELGRKKWDQWKTIMSTYKHVCFLRILPISGLFIAAVIFGLLTL